MLSCLFLALTVAFAPPPPAPELVAPTDLIMAQRGSLPIMISAPHGGVVRVPGSKDRTKGVTVRDNNTSQLAVLIAQRVADKLGKKPYFVIAEFSRKDADCNRPETPKGDDEAFNNDAAKSQYVAYHAALRTGVDEIRTNWQGRGILIDVHGQGRVPDAIIRGTRNGASMARVVRDRGREVLTGPNSIFGHLASNGYKTIPPIPDVEPPAKESVFDGGFITEHYGSSHDDGIDAIQMEFGNMRVDSLEKTARDVGDAIAAYYRSYLEKEGPHAAPVPEAKAPAEQSQPPR